ncbi:MAG: hypothetical protein ACO39Y_03465 [Ilumatobacteraceae bacterium]|nr:hypothetical protein [Actinomycetota bacterium]MDA3012467.1 hypothetical protein [Actinomycetota bacterium]MDA3025328.1 hypothetical protein [Actinomycetota bacterium]
MNVAELIDILKDLDQDAVLELAIVAPVVADDETITVDQYTVEGILPRDPADHDGESVVWLIGGESSDVDEFIEAIGGEEELPHGGDGDVIEMERWSR